MPRIDDQWATASGLASQADELDQLVYLSNLIGSDPRLVQPGGGNTSIKIGDVLLVKGSGTDLRTIRRNGFTRLSLAALAAIAYRRLDAGRRNDALYGELHVAAGCARAERRNAAARAPARTASSCTPTTSRR